MAKLGARGGSRKESWTGGKWQNKKLQQEESVFAAAALLFKGKKTGFLQSCKESGSYPPTHTHTLLKRLRWWQT